jgi:3-oxoacyl-[acyl-carrier-protein] synthase-1
VFGGDVRVNSTKGMTGHALGAAGAVEAVFAALAIDQQWIPGSANTRTVDPTLRARYTVDGGAHAIRRVVSNSFGFGGSNCSLVFGRIDGR